MADGLVHCMGKLGDTQHRLNRETCQLKILEHLNGMGLQSEKYQLVNSDKNILCVKCLLG